MIYILDKIGKGFIGFGARQISAGDLFMVEDGPGSTRKKAEVLVAIGWVLNEVSGLYEYTYANSKITANSEVEFIPHAASEDIVSAAQIKTHTPASLGQVIIQAVNAPGGDIVVDVIIEKVSDV